MILRVVLCCSGLSRVVVFLVAFAVDQCCAVFLCFVSLRFVFVCLCMRQLVFLPSFALLYFVVVLRLSCHVMC